MSRFAPRTAPRLSLPLLALALHTPLAARAAEGAAGQETAWMRQLEETSRRFLGVPYLRDPLGEGPKAPVDRDPLFRTDAFDCTTYVETVMALARAQVLGRHSRDGILEELRLIRYREGRVAFESRNHFPESDWIPSNIATGRVRDITHEVAGKGVRVAHASARIDRAGWLAARIHGRRRGQRTPAFRQPKAELSRLDYIPLAQAHEVVDRIPSGTILDLVRKRGAPLIRHQGFVFRISKGVVFRHAAQGRRVVEVSLERYLRQLGEQGGVAGIHLLEVQSPP
jgi:hypothetical protein